jgi:hypothetical protein
VSWDEAEDWNMTRLTLDPATLAKLHNLNGMVEVCDEEGRILGYFHPAARTNGVGGTARSPFSEEELRLRRQQRTGEPLATILDRLKDS